MSSLKERWGLRSTSCSKPLYQYSQTDRIFSFLTNPVAFTSFNTLRFFPSDRSFSRSLIPYLHFLAYSRFLFCLISFVFRNGAVWASTLFLFLPPSPLSLALPLTFSHFLSPSLIPTLQLSLSFLPPPFPLSFFSFTFPELTWTFSQSCSCLQRDPDQSGPDWIWRPRQHFWALKWQFWDAARHLIKQRSSLAPIHSSNYTFLYFKLSFFLPVNPWHFQAARSRMFPQALFCFSFRRLHPFFFLSVKPQSCTHHSTGKNKSHSLLFPIPRELLPLPAPLER